MNACKDCGAQADPRYTMDFTDVEPGAFLHWCEPCGAVAHEMNDALQEAFADRPGFAVQLEAAIDKVAQ